VGRMIQEFHRAPESEVLYDQEHFGFQRAFSVVFTHAQDSGELPDDISPRDLAAMLTALVMDGIREWTVDERVDLGAVLRQRTALLLAGARNLVVAPPRRRRPTAAGRRA
jgi:hypothetical protein